MHLYYISTITFFVWGLLHWFKSIFCRPKNANFKRKKKLRILCEPLESFWGSKDWSNLYEIPVNVNLTLLTYSSDLISGYIQEVGNRYNYFFYLYNYFLRDSFCSLPYSISLFCFVFSSLYYSLHWFLYIPLFFLKILNKHTTFINYMEPGRCYNFLISLLFIIINILF